MRIRKSTLGYLFFIALILIIAGIGYSIYYFTIPSCTDCITQNQSAVITSPTPSQPLANPHPTQGTCPIGFYYYENSTYSLCYPSSLIPYIDANIVDQYSRDGEAVKDAITLPDTTGNAEIAIIPSFAAARGVSDTSCETSQYTVVSGSKALVVTERQKTQSACGEVTSITTLISAPDHPHFQMYYQANGGSSLRYINEYSTMERTLRIK